MNPDALLPPATAEYGGLGFPGDSISPMRLGRPGSSFVFDAEFYLSISPDVAAQGVDALWHYENHGRAERRHCCEAHLQSDIAAVEASGVLFKEARLGQTDGRDVRSRLLGKAPAIENFDAGFVVSYYARTITDGENPFAFYCRHAHLQWCFPNAAMGQKTYDDIAGSALFDANYVKFQLPPTLSNLDALTYYCTEGFRAGIDPSPFFSTVGYQLDHPDITAIQMNPLLHYERHGKSEGRSMSGSGNVNILLGTASYLADRPTIIICSNEAGRSGAPIVGLNLARHLGSIYNVISILLRPGALLDDFVRASCAVAVCGEKPSNTITAVADICARFKIEAAILNSVEATLLLNPLSAAGIPVVSLIHDFAQYVYPFNMLAKTIAMSDRVVFPARLVKDAALRELAQLGFDPTTPRNLEVRPQGRSILPPGGLKETSKPIPGVLRSRHGNNAITVVGAGWVQTRKGVDLFIETARVLKHDFKVRAKFIWVGANYNPRKDLANSVFLADQIRASDLGDTIFFCPELSDLNAVWDAADIFFMSSRLDPFPNVALDALGEGLPVVCFDQGTGIAELSSQWPDHVYAAPYNDTRRAAALIAELSQSGAPSRRNPDAGLALLLSFEAYADDISRWVEEAIISAPILEALATDWPEDKIDPFLLRDGLPAWANAAGLTHTNSSLRRVAMRAAVNGVTLGRVRPGRSASLSGAAYHQIRRGEWPDEPLWEQDDQGIAVPPKAQVDPVAAILVTEVRQDVIRLAQNAFGHRAIGRFVVISDNLTFDDIAPLVSVAGRLNVSLMRPEMRPGAGAAAFVQGGAFLLIAPSAESGDWSASALSLWSLGRSDREGLQFAARTPSIPVDVDLSASSTRGGAKGLNRHLINDVVCRVNPTAWVRSVALIDAVAIPRPGGQPSLWVALLNTPELLSGQWAIVDNQMSARIAGYDLLYGRQPILSYRKTI